MEGGKDGELRSIIIFQEHSLKADSPKLMSRNHQKNPDTSSSVDSGHADFSVPLDVAKDNCLSYIPFTPLSQERLPLSCT